MRRNYTKRDRVLSGVDGELRNRGSGAFWKRVIEESGQGVVGVGLAGRRGPVLEAVDGRGSGVEIRFGVGRLGGHPVEWRAETVEVLSLRSGAKSIWAVEALDPDGADTGRVFLPMGVEEPVCRLKVEFSRVAGFEEGEIWSPRPLELPARGAAAEIPPLSGTVDGATLRLHSLTAPGGVVPGAFQELWNRWTGDSSVFTLWVEVSREGVDRRLTLVKAEDELGRLADVRSGLWSGEHYAFGLIPPAGATSLKLTFALHRSWVEELVVDTRGRDEVSGQQN